jgi:hypothetical protein
MITTLNENFTPQWNMQHYFGRVDPVATYQSTGRAFSISFKLVALHPSDLRVIYQKLKWITSMVYPEYDAHLRYRSGPVVRIRVGNIIDSNRDEGQRGLPGVITSLAFDYSDSTWEVETEWQLPREIDVSMGFQVLHDVPIGVLDGEFGGIGTINADKGYQSPAELMPANNESNERNLKSYVFDQYFRQPGGRNEK